jgi:hypothetical protein
MRRLAIGVVLAALAGACGGTSKPSSPPPGGGASSSGDDDLTIHPQGGPPADSEIHRRRNAACEGVGAKVTQCAVEDTRNDKAHPPTKDELAQLDQTAAINKREFIKACEAHEMSSRQVRVYEVCLGAETECDKFLACLDNATQPAK